MNSKYIIFACEEKLMPIVWAQGTLDHSQMNATVQAEYPGYKPISAGFCSIESTGNQRDSSEVAFNCFGESLSLKLKSGENDSEILTRMLIENE